MYNPNEIETIVTVQYRTPDGVVHDTLAEALSYTPPRPIAYKAWKSDPDSGIVPANLESCTFLFLPDANAAQEFEEDMNACDYTLEGIEGAGWYAWNNTLLEWESMSEDMRTVLEYLLPKK
jgi:hypothetical protein